MADSKLTALTALTGANVASNDVLEITDISDTTMDASGTSKKINASELAAAVFALAALFPPHTMHPGFWYNTCQIGQATRYWRGLGAGDISKIAVHVVGSSGNVSAGVYRNSGSGQSAVPSTRLATSGAVACPAAGYAEISLGATVTFLPGDWFGFSSDNTTVSVKGNGTNNGVNSNAAKGYLHSEGSVHPIPTTPSASPTYIIGIPAGLIGVA